MRPKRDFDDRPIGAKAVVRQRVDQFLDRRRSMVEQVRGEQVAKVGAVHLSELLIAETMTRAV